MRKTSFQNTTIHQQSKLFVLTNRVQYLKPQINSFHSVPVTKDSSSTMNTGNSTGANAGQIASIEASAAEAAVDINMEVDGHVDGTAFDPNEELIDYND